MGASMFSFMFTFTFTFTFLGEIERILYSFRITGSGLRDR
jgi:hypothetical protein